MFSSQVNGQTVLVVAPQESIENINESHLSALQEWSRTIEGVQRKEFAELGFHNSINRSLSHTTSFFFSFLFGNW